MANGEIEFAQQHIILETDHSLPRLLAIGDGSTPTGFARVLYEILSSVADLFDIYHLATNYSEPVAPVPWRVYGVQNSDDYYGFRDLPGLIDQCQPELVFVMGDIWVINAYVRRIVEQMDPVPPIVAYIAVDGSGVHSRYLSHLHHLREIFAYTDFGRVELQRAQERGKERGSMKKAWPKINVVPHGLDPALFHPIRTDGCPGILTNGRHREWTHAAKRALYQDDEYIDSFIVLNANRNQPRKRIDTTMIGFSRFAEGKPANVKLYLHMGLKDAGWDIIELSHDLKIHDRLILTSETPYLQNISSQRLNLIYNATDVGINTSSGEGWGLVAFEHAATGAPQIVPDHSACGELWSQSGVLLKTLMPIIDPTTHVRGYSVDPDDVANALEKLYTNEEHYTSLSQAAFDWSNREAFLWPALRRHWRSRLSVMT